jgi:uncharacterized protein (TIGR02588 family)
MQKKAPRRGIPRSEWATAGCGAALLLASMVTLIYSALTSGGSPPRLSAHVVSIQPAGEQFLVTIEVRNEGGSTAADVGIEAELRQHGAVVERSEVTVDFVPPKSRRRAGILFARDPRANELKLRALGYREP